jgi:hypothetical protein
MSVRLLSLYFGGVGFLAKIEHIPMKLLYFENIKALECKVGPYGLLFS